jgi:hypothetical protein
MKQRKLFEKIVKAIQILVPLQVYMHDAVKSIPALHIG